MNQRDFLWRAGGVCSRQDPGAPAGSVGTGSERMVGAREKRAQNQWVRTARVPQRLRQVEAVHDEPGNHGDSPAAGERSGGAVCLEDIAAV